ncbi:crotonase/enoyl-CoA hydratase family protein [Sulfitobacter sabulilitoris]|uniref:Crotonase/enoyl-CoA hydratase family protein n=1 Tax=Sulfitobacter sabulilitoris TaxID=2562655 RepID=A0A5S3PD06_9RHOB|nr:crotonase/enoyl-CoA hydratase family protein [Sulfitobacter sabulilitoris]TMM51741.1 crotonase/enoyl-CoA hydratase family protein [Sulfitobacter sabulilitoris]
MTDAPVLIATEGATLIITINRPAARNAIDRATTLAIAEAIDTLETDDRLRVGILTGAGDHFCAGMDLKAFLKGERVEIEGRGLAGLTERPPRKPLIAAVEGYALAGGFEIALACDMTVASQTAMFGIPEVRRGLIAGSGGLLRLPQRIPRQIALEYALTGNLMDAATAHRWGLINRLTERGGALDAARALAAEVTANAPLAVVATKQIMASAHNWPAQDVWPRQNAILEAVIASDDATEGARAFAEKRKPDWSGR